MMSSECPYGCNSSSSMYRINEHSKHSGMLTGYERSFFNSKNVEVPVPVVDRTVLWCIECGKFFITK